jgi:hypothetical protein
MKRAEKQTYKVYGGVYDKWIPCNGSDNVFIPSGAPVAYELYETVVTAKRAEAVKRGLHYYNRNMIVVEVSTKTVVYERRNGREII